MEPRRLRSEGEDRLGDRTDASALAQCSAGFMIADAPRCPSRASETAADPGKLFHRVTAPCRSVACVAYHEFLFIQSTTSACTSARLVSLKIS